MNDQQVKVAELKFKVFNPLAKETLPDCPGNYIVVLRKGAKLPDVGITPLCSLYEGYEIIYTGISSTSLRKRDYKQHFIGNNAGRSTLRKSLGCLMGFNKVPRDKNKDNQKTKFGENDELNLSEWMKKNLLLFYLEGNKCEVKELEKELINYYNPPLNIQDNKNKENEDYRNKLRELRKNK